MSMFQKLLESQRNPHATLYVGNLDPQVDELLLYELFIQFGPVKLLNLPKDRVLRQHQGYGFVEYKAVSDAAYALEILRGVRLYSRTLKLKKTDPTPPNGAASIGNEARMSVGARLFINHLSPLVDEQYLRDTFSKFGQLIEKPWIVRDDAGVSRGYGFLEYDNFESSDLVIARMNGAILMNHQVSVEYAYKDGNSKARHGDAAERLLAEKAKANGIR